MLDYAQWLERAAQFMESLRDLPNTADYSKTNTDDPGTISVTIAIQPPLPERKLRDLTESCRLPVPPPLQRYWSEASRDCHCTYWWHVPAELHHLLAIAFPRERDHHISGGLEFYSIEETISLPSHFTSWAESFREQDYPIDARFWEHSIPFLPLGDGDHIGLYVGDNSDDPPVCYLCHDGCGASCLLAPSFDSFLTSWEKLGYLHPDFLWAFVNKKTGFLEPEAFPVELEAVRSLWRGECRADLTPPAREMTEAEWNACIDVNDMLEWLQKRGLLEERKLRLFNCALCRRVWDQMGPWSRYAVEVAERYADGKATAEELEAARVALAGGERGAQVQEAMRPRPEMVDFFPQLTGDQQKLFENGPFMDMLGRFAGGLGETMAFSKAQGKMHGVAFSAFNLTGSFSMASWEILQHLDEPQRTRERSAHVDLLRQVFGNPFVSKPA